MKIMFRQSAFAVVICCSFGAIAGGQQDDVIKSDDIVEALSAPRTRGLTRAISVRQKGKVNLNVAFEVNSSQLLPAAERQLRQLADALVRNSLADFRFRIAGHTDASGAAEYNRRLSEERAQRVMQFLVEHGVDPSRLIAVGYGEDMLLVTEDPEHADNRRVEITNIGTAGGN